MRWLAQLKDAKALKRLKGHGGAKPKATFYRLLVSAPTTQPEPPSPSGMAPLAPRGMTTPPRDVSAPEPGTPVHKARDVSAPPTHQSTNHLKQSRVREPRGAAAPLTRRASVGAWEQRGDQ